MNVNVMDSVMMLSDWYSVPDGLTPPDPLPPSIVDTRPSAEDLELEGLLAQLRINTAQLERGARQLRAAAAPVIDKLERLSRDICMESGHAPAAPA